LIGKNFYGGPNSSRANTVGPKRALAGLSHTCLTPALDWLQVFLCSYVCWRIAQDALAPHAIFRLVAL
jgi:hypothetical protein